MQKYQEKPISLVLRDQHGKYKVNQEALQLFLSIQGKLAIISVAGVYRTGKSFLLNTMLLNTKNGFAVGPTVNPKTKGIWVWGKPLIFKNQNDEIINVLILDSQGLGSTQQDANHDLRLFSITLLLSSAFMYNTVGAIDQNAIDRLGLVLRLCEHLKSDSYNDFPDFYWILRDFSLALVDKNNAPLTTKAYLEHCLSNQPGDSQYRNKIRQSIKQAFESRNCCTFVRPLMNEQSLQNLDRMQLEQLRPQFVEEVINFRKSIFGNLRVKTIKGRQIKGHILCQLINIYVDCINSDKLPVIQTGWQQLCLKQLHEVLYDIEQAVAKKVRDLKQRLPRSRRQLVKQQQMLMQQFQEIFEKRLKNNDKAKQYFKSVQEIITKQLRGVQEDMKIKNASQTQAFVRKEFQSIQKRLKQSQFKNMGQLVKQFQIFYEYYRKKCPYKDQIQTGLQLLMKKFSDCSLILFKNTQAKKDSQIEQLRHEIQKTKNEFMGKQQKNKQQKNQLQDRVAKLETNLEDLKKQNVEMSNLIQQLQGKLEIAQNMNNNSMEQELSHENLSLKKKIMDLQNIQLQKSCTYSQQINTLKQQIMLKTNQAQNKQKQRLQISRKYEQLQLIFKNTKQLNEQKIHQLIVELDQTTNKSIVLEKALKSKLAEKDIIIDQLEKTVEIKNCQITEINQKNSLENSMFSQMILQEEKKSLMDKQRQIGQLRSLLNNTKDNLQKRVKQLQTILSQKQTEYKISKLSIEQEKALLSQKIQFIKRESEEKVQKNTYLQQQINNYVQMIEEKDEQIQQLTNQMQQLKNFDQEEGEQIEKRISEMGQQLEIKNTQIKNLQKSIQNINAQKNRTIGQKEFKIQQLQIIIQKHEEELKNAQQHIMILKKQSQQKQRQTQQQIQNMKIQNQRYMDEQNRNAQLSLVQLKNFYQMQKQRLQKRLLQQRKKYEYNEANTIQELKNKYQKQIKRINEQNNTLSMQVEDLEEDMNKKNNQYQIKIISLEEDMENQRKSHENKLQIFRKKYQQAVQQLSKVQKQNQEDRIGFVKRIEGLNFELSKKQKQVLQANVKKQSLQAMISKKDSQLQNIKKTMHQQIQSSLKKVSETQQKYQRINEQFSKYKIEMQKQNALLNQRNQFLNAKITQLSKEKDTGSLKSFEKIEKNKINELKEQLDRQKSQNMSLQAKIQNLRKTQKQYTNHHKKEVSELQKQNMMMKQKIDLSDSKINELEIKLNQKTQIFKRQVDQMRTKYNSERLKLQAELDTQKEKLNLIEDEKKQIIFKLQMELALITDRISNVQLQRDQSRKQLEETQKRLQNALNQIKRQNQKGLDVSQAKRSSVDKRYTNQLELMKMSSKARQQQLEQSNKKIKEQIKILKQKNFQLQQKLSRTQKIINQDKNLNEDIEKLKRQREHIIMAHRNQLMKQSDEWKRKYGELEKMNRDLEKKNNSFLFVLERQKAKYNVERQQLTSKLKQIQDQLAWEKKKSDPKNKTQISKSKRFSMTASDVMGTNWH